TTADVQLERSPRPPVAPDKAGHWYQYINRYFLPYLNGSDLKIILFILDQQLGWSNIDAAKLKGVKISRSRFENGVIGQNARIYHAGTRLAPSTISEVLASLERRGAIHVQRRTYNNETECWYCLNWFWEPWHEDSRKPETLRRKPQTGLPENRVQRELSP